MAVAPVPPAANTVAELPPRLRWGNRNDVADDLVPWNARVVYGVHPVRNLLVAVGRTETLSATDRLYRAWSTDLPQTPHAMTFTTTSPAFGSLHGTVILVSAPPLSRKAYAV